uniref:Uncharacterized protein n=1 Tax=Anguilla anguilla TaxID=7936 RepID=A0A0E9T5S5_ANGAN
MLCCRLRPIYLNSSDSKLQPLKSVTVRHLTKKRLSCATKTC